MHVDVDYKWSGGNPAELFELREQLGKGYILIEYRKIYHYLK